MWSYISLLASISCTYAFTPVKSVVVHRPALKMIAEHHDTISNLVPAVDHLHSHFQGLSHDGSLWLADGLFAKVPEGAENAAVSASPYTKVDNTGFIGNIAGYIERAIDLGHSSLNKVGVVNSYGYAILLFTILVKAATLPLLSAQLESTSKLQGIAPAQKIIQEKYAGNEQAKNILLAQLFQVANVNPLAGCLPALVQIPIFLSLYRALTNLIAENKLSEPFLFIPNLQGPVYLSGLPDDPATTGSSWLSSIVTGGGEPLLGWSDTAAFLAIPLILYVSQTISQKVLTPPRDPSKPMSEQEEISQGILNNLPFIVAFFSINVPAGLGVYWIFNNVITTVLNLTLRNKFKDAPLPEGVTALLEQIENDTLDVDAMLAANPMGGPASTNPGLMGGGNNPGGPQGVPGAGDAPGGMPDFNKIMEEQQAKSAESAANAQEKAEQMMAEAIARANAERAIDVEAAPSRPSEVVSDDFQVTKVEEGGKEGEQKEEQ